MVVLGGQWVWERRDAMVGLRKVCKILITFAELTANGGRRLDSQRRLHLIISVALALVNVCYSLYQFSPVGGF